MNICKKYYDCISCMNISKCYWIPVDVSDSNIFICSPNYLEGSTCEPPTNIIIYFFIGSFLICLIFCYNCMKNYNCDTIKKKFYNIFKSKNISDENIQLI